MGIGKYRTRMKLLAVVRLGFVVMLVGCVGVAIVTIRNRHVLKGNEIRRVEEAIAGHSQEIEMWELRIASVKDRGELKRRLRWMGSNLQEIEAGSVLKLRAEGGGFRGPVVGSF